MEGAINPKNVCWAHNDVVETLAWGKASSKKSGFHVTAKL